MFLIAIYTWIANLFKIICQCHVDWFFCQSTLFYYSFYRLIRLSFNENPYGPSPNVAHALQLEFSRLSRYADERLAGQLAEQIAEYEHIPVEQVVLGEILDLLGLFLGSAGSSSTLPLVIWLLSMLPRAWAASAFPSL